MSQWISAAAFLSDVRLRVDAYRSDKLGVLIVEGPNDCRVFVRHVPTIAQVIPAEGRRMLLAAYGETTPDDRRHMLFLTDCDYEVRRGTLRPAPGLIITEGTDIESDLVNLGLLSAVVGELVPDALGSDQRITEITESALRVATEFARVLGRVRMAAQPLGVPLKLEEIKHRKYWQEYPGRVNIEKIIRTAHQRVAQALPLSLAEWEELVAQTPDDDGMCQGKDLLRAFYFALSKRFNLGDDVSEETVFRLLRTNLWTSDLARWSVASRIRQWESATGCRVLS